MPKRRADASSRRFFDQFARVGVSRFRANGTIDPAKREALIPFPDGTVKLLGVAHTRLKYGGSFSYFICPRCAKLAQALYVIDAAPLCRLCCHAINIDHRSRMGFGRADRRRASDKVLDALIAKVETVKPLMLKPDPEGYWGKRALMVGSRRLTETMHRRRIKLRLSQIASQQPNEGRLTITRGFKPRPEALAIIPDLAKLWKANSTERLQQALDKAQHHIVDALNSDDPVKRANAAKIMMRTKTARDMGFV